MPGSRSRWFDYARVMTLPTVVWCVADRRGEPARDAAADARRHEQGRGAGGDAAPRRDEPPRAADRDHHHGRRSCRGRPSRGTASRPRRSAWSRWPRSSPPACWCRPKSAPGIPWALAIFVGGMLSLTTVMNTYRINVWLGSYIVPAVQPYVASPLAPRRRARARRGRHALRGSGGLHHHRRLLRAVVRRSSPIAACRRSC